MHGSSAEVRLVRSHLLITYTGRWQYRYAWNDILKDESNIMSIALRSAEMKAKVREQGMFYSGHVKEVLC